MIPRLLPLLLILSLALGSIAPVSAGVWQFEGQTWTSEACAEAVLPSACVDEESCCRAAIPVTRVLRGDERARAIWLSRSSRGRVPGIAAVARPPGQGPPSG